MISLALLEVMDKEPSLPGIWIGAAVSATLGFWSARRWVWPGVLFLALEMVGLSGTHAELTDRFVGPAILQEAGRGYVIQSYAAAWIAIAATAAGLAWGLTMRKRLRIAALEGTGPGGVA